MIAADLPTAVSRLGKPVRERIGDCPVYRGGISTECGIPDFRSPGGLWTKNQPIPFDAFVASQDMRDESVAPALCNGREFRQGSARPRPSGARELLSRGKKSALITQNIDNLHQSSGIAASDVVELHGNMTYAVCLDCARRYEVVLGQGKI